MSSRFRRRACAIALPGIPTVLLVGTLIAPTDSTRNGVQLRAAAAHGVRWNLAAFCELLAAALFPLAAVGVARVVRERGCGLATVGSALAGLGSIGLAAIGLRHLFIYGLATAPQNAALHALDRLDHAAGPVIFPCMLAGPVALLVLVVSAARAGYLTRWAIAGTVLFFVADMLPIPAAEEIQGLAGIATFVFVAMRLLARDTTESRVTPAPMTAVADAA
jgi:hypothetical protein